MDFKDFLQLDEAGYGRNKGYAHGFASPHAPSLGSRHREDDEYHVPDPKPKDEPHAVHINGKKWKSFGSQSHASNVAKKIKGATVHKEEVEISEADTKTSKYSWGTMKTVHHNADFSIPLHPEHHQAIAKLEHGEEHKFKTEDGKQWTAKRIGPDVHFNNKYGQKTQVPHDHLKEEKTTGATKVVHTRTGKDGVKYHIMQDSPTDYSIHREHNGKTKHIDTYGSLHRAKSVLDNEVKEEVELDEAQTPQQKMDFEKMMKGAMSRDSYNTKWKKPLKSVSKVVYGKNVKEEVELDESASELDKHISTFSKGVKSSAAKQSTYKRDHKPIHNMKHVETDASHQAVFDHLKKMGYKKTSGYDPKPHEFDVHHNRDEMTSKTDPVHHSSGVSAHVETEHGGKTKVHFTHRNMKEETMPQSFKGFLTSLTELTDKQKKHIDKNNNGKIDGHDFKLLRKEDAKCCEACGMKESECECDDMKEAVTTGNEANGYHGQHHSTNAAAAYSRAHALVKKHAGEAGHLKDVSKPGIMVKHYLDSAHGRHLKGNENAEYIKKDFGKFKKSYKPEMHESVELDEAFINGREYASHGLMHPDHAKMDIHQPANREVDFYASKTGNKMQGKVMKNDGKQVHIQAHKELGDGKLHKFKVTPNLPKTTNEAVKKDDVPFDGPYTKTSGDGSVKDKSGAVHTPMSRARDLARKAMQKKMKEEFNIEITEEQAADLCDVASLDEKMDMAKADMGDVIKDFKKSDAPQFAGKSDEKRREMAIAAKMQADRGGKKSYREFVELIAPQIQEGSPDEKEVEVAENAFDWKKSKAPASSGRYDIKQDGNRTIVTRKYNPDTGHSTGTDDVEKPEGEKRGRGRPAGSTSGAKQKGSANKSDYRGIDYKTHSLHLPNSK